MWLHYYLNFIIFFYVSDKTGESFIRLLRLKKILSDHFLTWSVLQFVLSMNLQIDR